MYRRIYSYIFLSQALLIPLIEFLHVILYLDLVGRLFKIRIKIWYKNGVI